MQWPAEIYAVNFSLYKRPIIRDYFQMSRIRFVKHFSDIPQGAVAVVWGNVQVPEMDRGIRLIRVEDGFLRSVGLGADLIRPISLVMDSRGIYFDATRASDLEYLLLNMPFDDAQKSRARKLRQRIVDVGLTKYNVGNTRWQRPAGKSRVILVPGQVESDASLEFGAPEICRNIDLLKSVRELNPDAYVIYKPHPDVLAGLRARGAQENTALHWCDEMVTDVQMGDLLAEVDEVHVLTSLAGFEALLREKKVTCYGQPFYAGWGLTVDVLPVARRQRKLSLDELVAGVLILYPAYVCEAKGGYTTPEHALKELQARRECASLGKPWWAVFKHVIVKLLRLV
jgi:capsular polysaccharide export protein